MILKVSIFGSDKSVLNKHIFLFKKYISIYLNYFFLKKNNLFFLYSTLPSKSLSFDISISSIKAKKKKFVVLRSPHIFKKAKERFLFVLFKYSLTINLNFFFIHNSLVCFLLSKIIFFFLNYYSVGFFFKLRFYYNQSYKFI